MSSAVRRTTRRSSSLQTTGAIPEVLTETRRRTTRSSRAREEVIHEETEVETPVHRELSFTEVSSPNQASSSLSSFTSTSFSSPAHSKRSGNPHTPATIAGRRDGDIYKVDACDHHGSTNHNHVCCERRVYKPVDLKLQIDNKFSDLESTSFSSSSSSSTSDVIFDIFPFVFLGPGLKILAKVARVMGKEEMATNIEVAIKRHGDKRCHFPWKLIGYIIMLAGLCFISYIGVFGVDSVVSLRNNTPVTLSNGQSFSVEDMNRISTRVYKNVQKDVQGMDLVTQKQLGMSENKITHAFTSLNGAMSKQAITDLASLKQMLMTSIKTEFTTAVQAAKTETDKLAQGAAALDGKVDSSMKAINDKISQNDKAYNAKFVTHPQLQEVEGRINAFINKEVAAHNDKHVKLLRETAEQTIVAIQKQITTSASSSSAEVKAMEAKIDKLVNDRIKIASEDSAKLWTDALDKMRIELAGGNLVTQLSQQIRGKIMDQVTQDATKSALAAAENAGKAMFEANLAASVKASKEEASKLAEAALAQAIAAVAKAKTEAVAAAETSVAALIKSSEDRITAALAASAKASDAARLAQMEVLKASAESDIKTSITSNSQAAATDAVNMAKLAQSHADAAITAAELRIKTLVSEQWNEFNPEWTKAKDSIRKIAADVEALKSSVSAFETRFTGVDKRIDVLDGKVDNMNKAITAQLAQVKETDEATLKSISTTQGEIKAHSAAIAELQSRISDVALNTASSDKDAVKVSATIISDLRQQQQAHTDAIEAKFASLQTTVDRIVADKEGFSTDVSNLSIVQTQLTQQIRELNIQYSKLASSFAAFSTADSKVDNKVLSSEIDRALEKFAADRTSKTDFAMKSLGGRILTSSPTMVKNAKSNNLLAWATSCFDNSHPTDTLLEPSMDVGSCWPMQGSHGYSLIRLASPVVITSVTLQHVSKDIAIDQTSAPKQFRVYGVSNEHLQQWKASGKEPQGNYLGEFSYNINGPTTVQTFEIARNQASEQTYPYVKFEVMNNYGNQDFTCIYRFRVHGESTA